MKCDKLFEILLSDKPSKFIKRYEKEIFSLIPDLEKCKGFDQKNDWHIYDVYEHILRVVDGVSSKLPMRIAALFHDIGKPLVYSEDENGVGHFYGHWTKSNELFLEFAKKYKIDDNLVNVVSRLIFYHDINFQQLSDDQKIMILEKFNREELLMLFELKKSDLLAQNSKYHYLLTEYMSLEVLFLIFFLVLRE